MSVLVAEDELADVLLLKRAFRQCDVPLVLTLASDGDEALAQLKDFRGHFDLLLLDLNLPRKTGKEVLRELRQLPGRELLPVAVFSSSGMVVDVQECYALGANCYIEKPNTYEQLAKSIRILVDFWLKAATLPAMISRTL